MRIRAFECGLLCLVQMPSHVRLCFGQPCSPCESGRFRRPSPRSPSLSLRVDSCTARVTDKRRLPAYTYTPSGASPAQLATPCFGPLGWRLGTRASPSAIPSLRSALTSFGGYPTVTARGNSAANQTRKQAFYNGSVGSVPRLFHLSLCLYQSFTDI